MTAESERCRNRIMEPSSAYSYRCDRPATRENGLCGICDGARKRSEKAEADRAQRRKDAEAVAAAFRSRLGLIPESLKATATYTYQGRQEPDRVEVDLDALESLLEITGGAS